MCWLQGSIACGVMNMVHTQYPQRARSIQHTVHVHIIMFVHFCGDEPACDCCLGSTQKRSRCVGAVTRNENPNWYTKYDPGNKLWYSSGLRKGWSLICRSINNRSCRHYPWIHLISPMVTWTLYRGWLSSQPGRLRCPWCPGAWGVVTASGIIVCLFPTDERSTFQPSGFTPQKD